MAETNFLKDPRLIVWAGLAIPTAYIFMGFGKDEWGIWISLISAAAAFWIFNDNFINKAEVRIVKEQPFGPQEPYIPPGSEQWRPTWDELSGESVPQKTFRPPQAPITRQPPTYQPYQGGR